MLLQQVQLSKLTFTERATLELLAIELWAQEWGYRERNSGTELRWRDVATERKHEFRLAAYKLIKDP